MSDDPLTWTRRELADDVKASLNSLIEDRINISGDYRWVLPQKLHFPDGTPPHQRMPKTVHKWKVEALLQWKAALDQGRVHLQSIEPSRAEKQKNKGGRKNKDKVKEEKKRSRPKKADTKHSVEVIVDKKLRKEDYKVVNSEDSDDDIIELSKPTPARSSQSTKQVIDLTGSDRSESSDHEMEPLTPAPQQSAPPKQLVPQKKLTPQKLPEPQKPQTDEPAEHNEFSDFFTDDNNAQKTPAVRNPRQYIDKTFKRSTVMKDFAETVVNYILRGSEMKSVATSVSEAAWEKRRVSAEAEVNFLEEEIQQALSALNNNFSRHQGGNPKQRATTKQELSFTNGQVAMLIETLKVRNQQIVGRVADLIVVDALQAVKAAHRRQKGNTWEKACKCAQKYPDEKKSLVEEHNNEVTILQEELETIRSNIKQSNIEIDAQIRQDTTKYDSNSSNFQEKDNANAKRIEKLSDEKLALERLLKKANQLAAENLEKVQKLEENHALQISMLTQENNADKDEVLKLTKKLEKKKSKKSEVKESKPELVKNEEQALKSSTKLERRGRREAGMQELQEQLVKSMEENESLNARSEDLKAQVRELQRQLDSQTNTTASTVKKEKKKHRDAAIPAESLLHTPPVTVTSARSRAPSIISTTDLVTMSEDIETSSIPKKQTTVPQAALKIANQPPNLKKLTPILPPIPPYFFTRLAIAPPPPTTFLPITPAKSTVPHNRSNCIKKDARSNPTNRQPANGTSSKVVPSLSARKRHLEDHDDDEDLTREKSKKQKKSKHDTTAPSSLKETVSQEMEAGIEGEVYLPLEYRKSKKEKKPKKSKKNRITHAPPALSDYEDADQLEEPKYVPLTSKKKKNLPKDAETAPTPLVETSDFEGFDGLEGVEYHPLTYAKREKLRKDKKRKG